MGVFNFLVVGFSSVVVFKDLLVFQCVVVFKDLLVFQIVVVFKDLVVVSSRSLSAWWSLSVVVVFKYW